MIDHVYLKTGLAKDEVLATADFKNNQFTIKFPETVDANYLYSITSDKVFKGHNISDKSEQICSGEFIAYKD